MSRYIIMSHTDQPDGSKLIPLSAKMFPLLPCWVDVVLKIDDALQFFPLGVILLTSFTPNISILLTIWRIEKSNSNSSSGSPKLVECLADLRVWFNDFKIQRHKLECILLFQRLKCCSIPLEKCFFRCHLVLIPPPLD